MGRRLHRGATVAWLVGLALLSWGAPGADAAFAATLTGLTQTVHAAVGAWSVFDTRGRAAARVTA